MNVLCGLESDQISVRLCRQVVTGGSDPITSTRTRHGSLWIGDLVALSGGNPESRGGQRFGSADDFTGYQSVAIIPVDIRGEMAGLLIMKSSIRDLFSKAQIEFSESLVEVLGLSLSHLQAQTALAERVKELSCLYSISKAVEGPGVQLDDMLQRIVHFLPDGWQYPKITQARILLDGKIYSTCEFMGGWQSQVEEIVVKGRTRGGVEVAYSETKRLLDEGPFLHEERSLLVAIATQLANIIERNEAEEETEELQVQLRHADRLATIGQLAAGVAHELNEPLGGILGFAQLAAKCVDLPGQASEDIDRIIAASLHAREVIKKLLLFARQAPSQETTVDLNEVLGESLFFFEARCAKEGIRLVRFLTPNLPRVTADSSQLRQVITNLVVNAVQAMPDTGTLTIRTRSGDGSVHLIVEDTGDGIGEDGLENIFLPFFTTKDVSQGTGLGLAVVHGIVTSHGGNIDVWSKEGKGSRFDVSFPVSDEVETEGEG